MKKIILGTLLMAMALVVPIHTMAEGKIGVRMTIPPHVKFSTPPEVIVIPGTYVYAIADSNEDIFFYKGWWWRPWQGRWYRSRAYDSNWSYYKNVPSFYMGMPSDWRNDYQQHRWQGQPWNYQRIPHQTVRSNWNNWERDKYWEKQNTWGVPGYQPRPQAQKIQPSSETQRSGDIKNQDDGQRQKNNRGDKGKNSNKRKNKKQDNNH